MKVVLTQEVRGLGSPGDVLDVADGYARNYLIPKKFALKATDGVLNQVEKIRKTREIREVKSLDQAKSIADQLSSLTVRVPAKAGEGGRLFGQITMKQVAEAIAKAGGPKVDPKRIISESHIKTVGQHAVALKLHPEVEASVTVDVIRG
ncbi:MAG: 50S ribosomal protein L9 [Actinomycetota bacterium]